MILVYPLAGPAVSLPLPVASGNWQFHWRIGSRASRGAAQRPRQTEQQCTSTALVRLSQFSPEAQSCGSSCAFTVTRWPHMHPKPSAVPPEYHSEAQYKEVLPKHCVFNHRDISMPRVEAAGRPLPRTL
jgi:hypothetical protein